MTVARALQQGKSLLFYAEVETPLLDATVLLSEALGTSKESLLASLPDPVSEQGWQRYKDFLDMRCSGLPVSYIRRRMEEALRILEAEPGLKRVHDACTGSGCVAVAVKHSRPDLEVSASDNDGEALEVAAFNAKCLLAVGSRKPIRLYRSDLLSRVPGRYDLITANPPYLTDGEVDNLKKVGWPEPEAALRGGPDGMDLLTRLIRQAPAKLRSPGHLLLEADPKQMEALGTALTDQGFSDVAVSADLSGRRRVIRAWR